MVSEYLAYAELATIRALKPGDPIASSITGLLDYLATDFPTARILDPANSNNLVSDVLLPWEKSRIADVAQGHALRRGVYCEAGDLATYDLGIK